LNSVTWDTELLISIDGVLTKTTIGEFTDGYMESTAGTPDLEAHPQIRSPGSRTVTSASAPSTRKAALDAGRGVHAPPGRQRGRQQHGVQGDSAERRRGHRHARQGLLKRIGNKIVHATVDDFKVGDYLPMAATLQPDAEISTGPDRLGQPTKAVFMSGRQGHQSYVTAARCTGRIPAKSAHGRQEPQWWRQGTVFTLPFKRADAFMASFNVAKSAVNNTRAA
jgi:hypothetical protein